MEVICWTSPLLLEFTLQHPCCPLLARSWDWGLSQHLRGSFPFIVGWLLDTRPYIEPKHSFWKLPPFSHSLNKSISSSPREPFGYFKTVSLIPSESIFSQFLQIIHYKTQPWTGLNSLECSLPNASFPCLENQIRVRDRGREPTLRDLPRVTGSASEKCKVYTAVSEDFIFKSF